MEFINGEFYMKGCEWSSPERIHDTEELVSKVQEMKKSTRPKRLMKEV